MDTVTLTIDGRQITVEKGKTVLQAAIEGGIPVPYYCYHPGLGIDGSCRVCVVKIEKMPKLQTSCSTICADGMVVQTRTDDVVAARAGVFEFLLINHPLDCPVCDKGGECPLQDFSYTFGPDQSRMEFPRRVFDGEGVKGDVDFGPTLMLNRQRCILCTRCVRFMRDIDSDAQINIIDRGYGSEIATFQEEGVHSLLSGNLMDVCPSARSRRGTTGSSRAHGTTPTPLTRCAPGAPRAAVRPHGSRPSRNGRKARASSVSRRASIPTSTATGCATSDGSTTTGSRATAGCGNRSSGTMPAAFSVRSGGPRRCPGSASAWPPQGALNPDGVRFLLSAHASHEELFLFRRLAEELIGSAGTGRFAPITVAWRLSEKVQPEHTTFKVPAVDAPNVNGARMFGLVPGEVGTQQTAPDVSALRAAAEAGLVSALYVFDPGPAGSIGDTTWIVDLRASGKVPLLVVQGVVTTDLTRAADFVLPGASYVEKEASYTNEQGRLQGTSRAIPAPGDARDDWQILVHLSEALGVPFDYASPAAVRADIVDAVWRGQRFRGADRRSRSANRCRRDTGCRPRTPRNDGNGTSCSRTCRP